MRPLLPVVALLALAAAGCRMPWEPDAGPVVGRVTYPSGTPARAARVSLLHGETTQTAFDGSFYLSVPSGLDTLVVSARDGFDGGVYSETHSGVVRVPARHGAILVRVVLSQSDPI